VLFRKSSTEDIIPVVALFWYIIVDNYLDILEEFGALKSSMTMSDLFRVNEGPREQHPGHSPFTASFWS